MILRSEKVLNRNRVGIAFVPQCGYAMSDLDEREVKRFSKLASQWWDGDDFATLHKINPLRVEYITSNIESKESNSRIKLLDVGCGGGILCESLARVGYDVTGVDPCADGIKAATEHARTAGLNISYFSSDLTSFVEACAECTYDVITLMEVVEHVADLHEFLFMACRLLKKDGVLFLSTFNRTVASLIFGVYAAEYILGMVPRGTHQWNKFVKPSEIADALRLFRVDVTDIKGISYNIFRDTWSLSNNLGINYILAAKKLG